MGILVFLLLGKILTFDQVMRVVGVTAMSKPKKVKFCSPLAVLKLWPLEDAYISFCKESQHFQTEIPPEIKESTSKPNG